MTTDAATEAVVEPQNVVIDPDFIEPAPARLPSQLWQPWTLIVPALLIIPLLCLAFAGQISPTSDEVLSQKRQHSTATTETTTQPRPQASKMAWFVPGDDEQLHPRAPFSNGFVMEKPEDNFAYLTREFLNALFKDAPGYFPPGTKVQDVKLEQGESGTAIAHISLNETFWNSDYWAMDARTRLAPEAIAHTVRSVYRGSGLGDNVQVLLLRDGNPVSVLGEMDMADPITPDDSLVAAP